MIRLNKFYLSALVLGALSAQPALADDDNRQVKKSPLDIATEREVTIVRDEHGDDYLNPTLGNLSKLYWKLGVFDFEDDVAVDNYLRINECGIFTAYSKDEFEWIEIRNATRQRLKNNIDEISNQFKFLMPIYLGAYDPDRGGFELVKNSGFPNLKRIEFVSPYLRKEICNTVVEVPDYEKNILLILREPLDYTFVEMDDHVAQAFILRKQQQAEEFHDERVRMRRYQREAYIRLRMNIHEYQGNIMGRTLDGNLAILYGTLQGIDIFDDMDQKLLLASYSREELLERKKAKMEAQAAAE